jgi:hypothetical protein
MRKFLFVLASTASWATMNAAVAQYAPGYYAPGYFAPRYYAPGPTLRDQRERATEDWRQRHENQSTANNTTGVGVPTDTRITRIPTDTPIGECAIGMSEETCRRRGQKYNPPNNAGSVTVGQKNNDVEETRYVGECAIGMSEETCRRRGQKYNPPK